MSRSNDPGHYFQTTSAIEEEARRATKAKNTKGNPVKLPSKLLAVLDGGEGHVFVAEAAGCVKRVLLEAGEVTKTYSGPTAPLTSLAVSLKSNKLFAGCWDKSIWSWDIGTGKVGKKFLGHTDFVKAVLVFSLQGKEILVSGSADATIIVWDATTGNKIHMLKGHARGILALDLDVLDYAPTKENAVVFSAGSDREIRRWSIGLGKAEEVKEEPSPIIAHETSIDAIHFDTEGDLWTASADRSSKCLSRTHSFTPDSTFSHPDYVRDVVVDEDGGWVVTACRDEHVRVFEKASGKLHHVFEGHFEEVTGLVLLSEQKVVSVSIDGTMRLWSLKARELAEAVKEAEDEKEGVDKEEAILGKGHDGDELMTAEEEAELAALMEDSE